MNTLKIEKAIKEKSKEKLFTSFVQVAINKDKADAHTFYMGRAENNDGREIRYKVVDGKIIYQGYELCEGAQESENYLLMTRYDAEGNYQYSYYIYLEDGENAYVKRKEDGVESYYSTHYPMPKEYQAIIDKVITDKKIKDKIIGWSRKQGFSEDKDSFTIYIKGER